MQVIERFRLNIPIKILLAVLAIEVVLVLAMGLVCSSRFARETDSRVAARLALPGALMNRQTLAYDKVRDLHVLGELVQEQVVDAFVFDRGGKIFLNGEPAREGRGFVDFLLAEEKNAYGLKIDRPRQYAFVDGSGAHFISSVTPLTAHGTRLGGLYVRIAADAIEQRKIGVVRFFGFGAVLAVLVTTLVAALFVHRLVVPRLTRASRVLQRYGAGDLAARIADPGPPDQLGQLMRQVNTLLAEFEGSTGRMQALDLAAGRLSRAGDGAEVGRIAADLIEDQLPLRRRRAEDGVLVLLTLPHDRPDHAAAGASLQFVARTDGWQLSPAEAGFVQVLSGLMASALDRIEALRRLSETGGNSQPTALSAREAGFRARLDGTLIEIDPGLAVMMGYDSVADMFATSGTLVGRYVGAEDRQRLRRQLLQAGKFQGCVVAMLRRDGSVFQASMSASLVRDKGGALTLIEGRIVDISQRRQRRPTEQGQRAADTAGGAGIRSIEAGAARERLLQSALAELETARQQLARAEKMAAVGMTAGGVAHDLNNILVGVISYPELLLATTPADSPFRAPLEAILASGRRAAAVVADLLTLARGSTPIKQHLVLHSLVEEYLESAEFLAMIRLYPEVRVRVVDESAAVVINCSPVHIQKVIMNLVMNAVEAVAADGGSVVVKTGRREPDQTGDPVDGGQAVLEVGDDGPGIPVENQSHIFEPFYTRKVMGKKGTGLGLTVVWNVVKEHGGRLELDSGAEGTTFRIFLPAVQGREGEDCGGDEIMELRGRGTILVVDDEWLQRDIASRLLTSFGYEVMTAESGQAAIDLLRRRSVDLVVLDMLMPPGMNGLQTYRQILALHPGQKALIVSGFSNSDDVRAALELGAGGFVRKPYTMHQIARAIRTELERPPAAG